MSQHVHIRRIALGHIDKGTEADIRPRRRTRHLIVVQPFSNNHGILARQVSRSHLETTAIIDLARKVYARLL